MVTQEAVLYDQVFTALMIIIERVPEIEQPLLYTWGREHMKGISDAELTSLAEGRLRGLSPQATLLMARTSPSFVFRQVIRQELNERFQAQMLENDIRDESPPVNHGRDYGFLEHTCIHWDDSRARVVAARLSDERALGKDMISEYYESGIDFSHCDQFGAQRILHNIIRKSPDCDIEVPQIVLSHQYLMPNEEIDLPREVREPLEYEAAKVVAEGLEPKVSSQALGKAQEPHWIQGEVPRTEEIEVRIGSQKERRQPHIRGMRVVYPEYEVQSKNRCKVQIPKHDKLVVHLVECPGFGVCTCTLQIRPLANNDCFVVVANKQAPSICEKISTLFDREARFLETYWDKSISYKEVYKHGDTLNVTSGSALHIVSQVVSSWLRTKSLVFFDFEPGLARGGICISIGAEFYLLQASEDLLKWFFESYDGLILVKGERLEKDYLRQRGWKNPVADCDKFISWSQEPQGLHSPFGGVLQMFCRVLPFIQCRDRISFRYQPLLRLLALSRRGVVTSMKGYYTWCHDALVHIRQVQVSSNFYLKKIFSSVIPILKGAPPRIRPFDI